MSQNKTTFITYLDKIEKSYLTYIDKKEKGHVRVRVVKSKKRLFRKRKTSLYYSPHYFEIGFPQKEDLFKGLKSRVNKPSFILSVKLLNRVKQVADLINLRTKFPNHYIYEFLIELDDLLAFIVHGYYTTNSHSYSEKLSEFFDLVLFFNNAITLYIDHDHYIHRDYYDKFSHEPKPETFWFEMNRRSFSKLFKIIMYDNYQSFQSDSYYPDLRFTIKIVKDKLQIVYKKKYKPTSDEDYESYESYKIIDEFNKKNYEFKLNYKKIFEENVAQKGWYKTYLSEFYFSFESIDFPDSLDAMGKIKSLNQVKSDLDQFFLKHSNNKQMLKKEIFKRIDENSGVDYILDEGYLKYLNNSELLQLITPFMKLLNTYMTEFRKSGNHKYYRLWKRNCCRLLKGYFAFWRGEKNLERYGLRFDGYYHNFYYYTVRKKEKVKFHTDLKLYNDGTIKFGEADDSFDYAQGRYIYSSNKIYFFLSSQRYSDHIYMIVICEGIVSKDGIDISRLYGSLPSYSPYNGKYKFTSML